MRRIALIAVMASAFGVADASAQSLLPRGVGAVPPTAAAPSVGNGGVANTSPFPTSPFPTFLSNNLVPTGLGSSRCPASATGAPPFNSPFPSGPPGPPCGLPPGPPGGLPPGPPGGFPPGLN